MFNWSESDKIAIPIMLVIVTSIAVLLHFLLKNKSEKIKNIPLHIISIALIILEISKQIYYLSSGNYPLSVIPVHFCSLIVVIIALAQFLPKKYSNFFQVPAVVFTIVTLILMLAYPHSVLGSSSASIFLNFPSFHAFVFHSLVVAYPIFNLCLVSHNLKWINIISIPICIIFYATYAIPIAFSYKINYMNILSNAFPPLESFRIAHGQVAYEIIWFLITIAICCLLFVIWYLINKIISKRSRTNA